MLKKCFPAGRVVSALLLAAGLIMFAPGRASAVQSVELAWDASSSPDIINYNIYYWQQGSTTTNMLAVGNATSATVSGLADGVTYYFYLTVTDALGRESADSSVISYTTPAGAVLQMQVIQLGGGAPALSVTAVGNVPAQWMLECSTNLLNWTTYATGTNATVNVQVSQSGSRQNFFRLRSF